MSSRERGRLLMGAGLLVSLAMTAVLVLIAIRAYGDGEVQSQTASTCGPGSGGGEEDCYVNSGIGCTEPFNVEPTYETPTLNTPATYLHLNGGELSASTVLDQVGWQWYRTKATEAHCNEETNTWWYKPVTEPIAGQAQISSCKWGDGSTAKPFPQTTTDILDITVLYNHDGSDVSATFLSEVEIQVVTVTFTHTDDRAIGSPLVLTTGIHFDIKATIEPASAAPHVTFSTDPSGVASASPATAAGSPQTLRLSAGQSQGSTTLRAHTPGGAVASLPIEVKVATWILTYHPTGAETQSGAGTQSQSAGARAADPAQTMSLLDELGEGTVLENDAIVVTRAGYPFTLRYRADGDWYQNLQTHVFWSTNVTRLYDLLGDSGAWATLDSGTHTVTVTAHWGLLWPIIFDSKTTAITVHAVEVSDIGYRVDPAEDHQSGPVTLLIDPDLNLELRAFPNVGTAFPSDYPEWRVVAAPEGSALTTYTFATTGPDVALGGELFDVAGTYIIEAACGTNPKTIELTFVAQPAVEQVVEAGTDKTSAAIPLEASILLEAFPRVPNADLTWTMRKQNADDTWPTEWTDATDTAKPEEAGYYQWRAAYGPGDEGAIFNLTVYAIRIDSIDSHFAPSVENLDITYTILPDGYTAPHIRMQVFNVIDEDPIYQSYDLTATGEEVTFEWDGMANLGEGNGTYIGPAESQYRIKLSISEYSDHEENSNDQRAVSVLIHSLTITPDYDAMLEIDFDPATTYARAIVAEVKIKDKSGNGVTTSIPIRVDFTFEDPDDNNTPKTESYSYAAGKSYGKKGDPEAIYWYDHSLSESGSSDGYKSTCYSITSTEQESRGKAFIAFLPSSVGGDDYRIRGSVKHVFDTDTASLAEGESGKLTVYRKLYIHWKVDMDGVTHVAANCTYAIIQDFFGPAHYSFSISPPEGGTQPTISEADSVDYIGLWTPDGNHQKDWNAVQVQRDNVSHVLKYGIYSGTTVTSEVPTPQQLADAESSDPLTRVLARAEINKKAQAWVERIEDDARACENSWLDHIALLPHTIAGLKHLHPKFSPLGGDSLTTLWPEWVEACVAYGRVPDKDPDSYWSNVGGSFYHSHNIIAIFYLQVDSNYPKVIAHELGHKTKTHFPRQEFGPGDHSEAPGLMDPSGSKSAFSADEKKILRGVKVP